MIDNSYFKNFPELESERLLLRQFVLSDASEVQLIRSNEKVMSYMDTDRHMTVQDSEKFIGDFAFFKIDNKNSRAEIGYTLMPEFWGKGLMREAMNLIFNFGFNRLNLHSLEANINPENESSRSILKKFGFVKEAYFRENYFYNGVYLDSEIYSLLKTDFNTNNIKE
ncbi:GNAT family N-acetyltransferase [Changchengzhania lutea]|uniref:GNAT family N-acetyltransferase n=1 Tax=Changchengzhania lutea TaxID=2049305 RepID=UPI00115C48FE|nr:GNAT family protein [Changchengzhania lutea]